MSEQAQEASSAQGPRLTPRMPAHSALHLLPYVLPSLPLLAGGPVWWVGWD